MHCLQCTAGKVTVRCVNCLTVLALCKPCANEIQQNFCSCCYTDGITPVVLDWRPSAIRPSLCRPGQASDFPREETQNVSD